MFINSLKPARFLSQMALATVVVGLLAVGSPSLASHQVPGKTAALQQTATDIPDTLIKHVGFGPTGEWVILYGLNGYSSAGLADPVTTKLSAINDATEEIQWISFGSDGAWLISSATSFYYDKLPADLNAEIDRLIKAGNGNDIKYVAFAPNNGWVVIWGTNGFTTSANFNQSAVDEITKLNSDGKVIKQLTFDSNGQWVIVYGNNGLIWSDKVDPALITLLKKINDSGDAIRQVSFSPDDGTSGIGWVVLYGQDKTVGDHLPKAFIDAGVKIDPKLVPQPDGSNSNS